MQDGNLRMRLELQDRDEVLAYEREFTRDELSMARVSEFMKVELSKALAQLDLQRRAREENLS